MNPTSLQIKKRSYQIFKKALERKQEQFPGTEITISRDNERAGILQVNYCISHPLHGSHISSFNIYGWENPGNPEMYAELSLIQELFICKPVMLNQPLPQPFHKRLYNIMLNL